MIDSSDRVRIAEAKTELHRIISDREMNDSLLLVFANKQDIAGAMTPTEVTEKLELNKLKDKIWYVVPSCATTGEGLFEGLVSLMEEGELHPRLRMHNTKHEHRDGSQITSKLHPENRAPNDLHLDSIPLHRSFRPH